MKRVQGWKLYPNPYNDAELIRMVTGDQDCTPLERHLAMRLDKMLYAEDRANEQDNRQMELFDGYNA